MNRGGTPQPHPKSVVQDLQILPGCDQAIATYSRAPCAVGQDRPILTLLRSGDRNLQGRRTAATPHRAGDRPPRFFSSLSGAEKS